MRLALLATAEFAVPVLQALVSAGHEVVVGTQPARPAGRGRETTSSPAARAAAELGIEAVPLDDINTPAGLAWLQAVAPDALLVVAFGQKLSPAVRAFASWGCFNVHPSLLPRWRGAAPVPAAVLAGDEETGVCVQEVAERMDAGDLLACRRTRVDGKTAGELLDELARIGGELLVDVLDALARGPVTRHPQDEAQATRSRKLLPDDGRIRWEEDAEAVDRRVRAVTPRPGAFSLLSDGTRLGVLAGRPVPVGRVGLPGEVLDEAGRLVVGCGRGAYEILHLRQAGRRPLDVPAFLRGRAVPPGTRLGP